MKHEAILRRAETAERIAIAASGLARTARANGMEALADLLEQAVLEAWREASGEKE